MTLKKGSKFAYLDTIMDNVPNMVSWTIERDAYLGTIMDNVPNTWTYKHKPQTIRIHKEFRFIYSVIIHHKTYSNSYTQLLSIQLIL